MDELAETLQEVLGELRDLNRSIEQINDGLFNLNLHVGADVSAWTGGRPVSDHVASDLTRRQGSGTVKWFNPDKGYGFIAQKGGGADVFVHYSAVPSPGFLQEGQPVLFEMVDSENGPMVVSLQFG